MQNSDTLETIYNELQQLMRKANDNNLVAIHNMRVTKFYSLKILYL